MSTHDPAIRVRVLGPLVVERSGAVVALSPTERGVLTVLVAARGREVGVDEIVDRVWGQDPPRCVRKALQTHVVALRRKLGRDAVATGSTGYRLALPTAAVDVWEFEAAAIRGVELVIDAEYEKGARTLAATVAMMRGGPWSDLRDIDRVVERSRTAEITAMAEDRLVQARLELGHVDEAIVTLERLVAADPFRERRWALLMLALYRAGRRAESLRTFQRARDILLGSAGLEPGEALRRLEQQVLGDDPELAAGAPVAELVA